MAWGPPDSPRVIAPPPLIYLGMLCAALAVDRLAGVPLLSLSSSHARALGGATLAAGVGLAVIATAAFKRVGTNVVPNKPATALVTNGPFARSRNPGYIGQTLMFVGLAFALRSASALAALPPLLVLIDKGVVAREERYLQRKFGAAFRDYAGRVPRWL